MILEPQGHGFHAYMKKHDLGNSIHEKVALAGRISNDFKIVRAQRA